MANIQIAGFSSQDKTPGPYGEIKYGASRASAASIPLLLLLVGLGGSASTAAADTEVVDVYDDGIADTAFVAGSELACMCYDALEVDGVAIKAIRPAAAGGAVAATLTITFTGPAASTGDFEYWINGKAYSAAIPNGTAEADIAADAADVFNSDPKCPFSALAVGAVVTLTCKTPGVRGNQHIIRQNRKVLPSGVTSTLAGGVAIDTDRVPASGGAGVESYTNLMATIRPTQYDRIALAANDAASLAAWETQIDAQAGVLEGLLEQVVVAVNGTQSAGTSIAQTTLNNPLFQCKWLLNSETHPSRLAAQVAALRTQAEQDDPAAALDGVALPACAPQHRNDWPKHPNLVAALNNGLSPLSGGPDGKVRIIRSITTKCLNGTAPDYSTLDTSEVTVPQFVLKDLKLYWSTEFLQGNPRTAADDPSGTPRPAGIATPSSWNSEVTSKLRDYEQGKIGGKQIAPIIIDVDQHLPVSTYDGVAERIMSAIAIKVAPANHQIGISVRQV